MMILEVFEEWKKTASPCIMCSYGRLKGGSGYLRFDKCKHPNHKDVRYGCSLCPKNCLDVKRDYNKQYKTFLRLYTINPRYFNEKYDIGIDSRTDYININKPRYIIRKDAESIATFNKEFGSQFLDIIPESPENFD